jgi:serine/threonine-protein kinase
MPVAKVCPSCATPLPDEAAFCFMCGAATPQGIDRATGELRITTGEQVVMRDLDRLRRALGDNYELKSLIGRGGFAEVYLLRDLRLKRDLALKALRPELTFSPALMARFRREAETVAALRHPHIVPIYDIGEADGVMFIIMPLIQGESLKALLVREGPRPHREAARILLEAADALGAAHDAGVIHRDVKPENMMLEGKGRRVQLMDFGIAKALDASDGAGLTSTGLLVGTPHYMSPEQASGDLNLDHRSDQYSLAVVGYQMITGELPFEGESTRAVLFQQMVGVPKSLKDLVPDVPAALAYAIEKALSKERTNRYASVQAFSEAIAGPDAWPIISTSEARPAGTPAATPAPAAATPAARRPWPRWAKVAAATVGSVAIVAALATLSRGGGEATTQTGGPAPADSASVVASVPTPPAVSPDRGPAPAPAPPPPAPSTQALGTRPSPPPAAASQARPRPAGPVVPVPPPTTGARRDSAPAATCATAFRASNWATALTLCREEGERGSASASRLVATMYQRGDGVAQSDPEALSWYRRAAEGGDLQAWYRLGLMLAAAPGGPQGEAEATQFLRRAAEANLSEAWPVLAERYQQGLGTRRNDQEALYWFRKAAEQGDAPSQYNLGMAYARGRGVNKSESEAAAWFERAAAKGVAAAQYELAMAYLRGRGLARSDSLGLVWLERAAQQGHQEAAKELAKRRPPG